MKSKVIFWTSLLATAPFQIRIDATRPAPSGQVAGVGTGTLGTPGAETNNTTGGGQGQFQDLTPWNIQDESATDSGDEMDPPAPRGAGGVLAEPSALVQPAQVSDLNGSTTGVRVLNGRWKWKKQIVDIEDGVATLYQNGKQMQATAEIEHIEGSAFQLRLGKRKYDGTCLEEAKALKWANGWEWFRVPDAEVAVVQSRASPPAAPAVPAADAQPHRSPAAVALAPRTPPVEREGPNGPAAKAPAAGSKGISVLDGHWQKGCIFMLIEDGEAWQFEKEVTVARTAPIKMIGPETVQLILPRSSIEGKLSQSDGVQQLVFNPPAGVYHKLPDFNIVEGPKQQVGVLNGRWQTANEIVDIADGKVTFYDEGKTASTGKIRYDDEFNCELTRPGLGAVKARIQGSNKLIMQDVGTWYKFPPDFFRAPCQGRWEGNGFLVLDDTDAFAGENHKIWHDGKRLDRLKCKTDDDLSRCKLACKHDPGVGAFVKYDGVAYFRRQPWRTCYQNRKDAPRATLYLHTKEPSKPTAVQPRRHPAAEVKAVSAPHDERPGDGVLVSKGSDAFAGKNHDFRAQCQGNWEWKRGFLVLQDKDAFAGENHKIFHDGKTRDRLRCKTKDDVRMCKLACKDAPGVEAFVKYDGFAYFRNKRWRECDENRVDVPGAVLYLHTKVQARPTAVVRPPRRPTAEAKAVPAPRHKRPGDGFLVLKGKDAFAGENHDVRYDGQRKKTLPCNNDQELRKCKLACKDTEGVEAFTVFEGTAYFRGKPWKECQENQKDVPKATLYLYTKARTRRTATKAARDGFLALKGKDAFAGENHDVLYDGRQEHTLPCNSVYELQRCKLACKDTQGVEAFVVFQGTAYFRGRPWKVCQDNQKDVPGATLYLYTKARDAAHTPPKVSTVPAAVVEPRSSPAGHNSPTAKGDGFLEVKDQDVVE